MLAGKLVRRLEQMPVIAAVKSDAELAQALKSGAGVVFVLYGDILTIHGIVERLKQADKIAFVHIDLLDGLSAREIAIDFIRTNTRADGVISTKPALLRFAKSKGLLTVQRFFLLDSLALKNIQRQIQGDGADLIEVLPGVMPKVIRKIAATAQRPIIAGGLIADKEDVLGALGAGALAVSSTNPEVWFL